MSKIIVIGAGAAGLMAGITAARSGAEVILLERNEKAGKKLLASGNGKCNLTYDWNQVPAKYHSDDSEMTEQILEQFPPKAVLDFFREIGVLCHSKHQGFYPRCEQAAWVVEALLQECRRLKIKIKCTETVQDLYHDQNTWFVKTNSWLYEGQAVILCCGSKAVSALGGCEIGYDLAEILGHTVHTVLPALSPLRVKEAYAKLAGGVRNMAKVCLYANGTFQKEEMGELQWTDYGISGIAVFQLSALAIRLLHEGQLVTMQINLLPDYSSKQLEAVLQTLSKHNTALTLTQVLNSVLPRKLTAAVLKAAGFQPSIAGNDCSSADWKAILHWIFSFEVTIFGEKGFDFCQICQGGVSFEQINPVTLESGKCKGIYFAGEMLDIDGACGGYNLQWAWSSGYAAGKSAAERLCYYD